MNAPLPTVLINQHQFIMYAFSFIKSSHTPIAFRWEITKIKPPQYYYLKRNNKVT